MCSPGAVFPQRKPVMRRYVTHTDPKPPSVTIGFVALEPRLPLTYAF
jgi:hypothetical protein